MHEDFCRLLSKDIGKYFSDSGRDNGFFTWLLIATTEFNLDLWLQVLAVFECIWVMKQERAPAMNCGDSRNLKTRCALAVIARQPKSSDAPGMRSRPLPMAVRKGTT
jgi:hypothetical protein